MSAPVVQSAGMTDVGKVRKANEDAWVSIPELGVYGVADGMGGAAGGAFASKTVLDAVARISHDFADLSSVDQRIAHLRQVINQSSRAILTWAENEGISGTGTTLVLLTLDPRWPSQAAVLHAGDSRAYLLRSGRLRPLTRDHSLAESCGDGRDHSLPALFRNVVTNAVGMNDTARLEETHVALHRGDTVLLCSDGLYRMVDEEEIRAVLASPQSLEEQASALVTRAIDHGGKDNVTVVLIHIAETGEGGDGAASAETRETDVPAAPARLPPDESPSTSAPVSPAASAVAPPRASTMPAWLMPVILLGVLVAALMIRRFTHEDGDRHASTDSGVTEASAVVEVAPILPAPDPVAVPLLPAAAVPPPPAPEPTASEVPVETVAALIERARATGDWSFPSSRLSELDASAAAGLLESSRAWMDEWNRARSAPAAAREELQAVRREAEAVVHAWSAGFAAPEIAAWPEADDDAARAFCLGQARIQQAFFAELDDYMNGTMLLIGAFGVAPGTVEARLRGVAGPRGTDGRPLDAQLRTLRELTAGLQRWTERVRDLPVGITEVRNVAATFTTPLEQGARTALGEVAEALGKMAAPATLEEARPAVRSFHEAKGRYLRALDDGRHLSAAGRAELTPLLRELLSSPGFQDLAARGSRTGGPAP